MKRVTILLLLLCSMTTASAQVSFGQSKLMNDGWRFLRVDSALHIYESAEMAKPDYDDSGWRRLSLPHDWGAELPMSAENGSCQGYKGGGIGWYRKNLNLGNLPLASSEGSEDSGGFAGRRLFAYFEGVYNHSEVYLNGHLLGYRPSGFVSFMYDLTPHLRPDGDNVLAVRVNHSQENDSRWYTGSGIYRNVWLVTSPEVHLAQWGTAYRLISINDEQAVVEVDVETTDDRRDKWAAIDLNATVDIKDADGNTVASTTVAIAPQEKKTVALTIAHPHRWNLDDPYLYNLATHLRHSSPSGEPEGDLDSAEGLHLGLRTLSFSPNHGFALNGKWMKVKGVCLHDDAGILGTAVPKEVWRRRLAELKTIGVNAIRMSHNPHAPELYDLCDELGLLVMDEASDEWEFPKRKWLKGWNKGEPGYQGTYTYFEEWIERDVADMVRRDRHHPSIFMWSVGNEVDYPNDPYSHPVLNGNGTDFTQPAYGGYKPDQPNAERIGRIAQRLARVVKDIDNSRPTTGALAGVVMSNETAYPTAIDVVGYNYTESRYQTDHERYPQRIIYGSENRHDLAAWKAVSDNEHIFGQFLWTGIDYLGESGPWPARGSSAGLLDMAGFRKPIGWYRAALWSEQPTCYLGSYPLPATNEKRRHRRVGVSPYAPDVWNYHEGQRVRVVCYTNATEARLTLNGQPVGGTPKKDKDTDILYWDIDYAAGTLRCETDNGASYELITTGAPDHLRVSHIDPMHVVVEMVDAAGHRVQQANNEVTVTVEDGRLLGLENGNIMAPSSPRHDPAIPQNRMRLHNGRLMAYVTGGTVKAELSDKGMRNEE